MYMKIVVNGQLINYSDEGNGKVVVMLHGWGMSLGNFDDLAHALSKKFRVIRLDFPGFGSSPPPLDAWSVSDYTQNVQAFLKKYGVPDVYAIIAHSFGGRVAIKLIGGEHIKISKLVLIGSGGVRHSSSVRQQMYRGIAKTGSIVLSLPVLRYAKNSMRQKLYKSAGATDYLESGMLKETFLKVINEDLQNDAESISVDTLMLWGENDDQTPVSDAKLLHKKIRNSRLIIYPHAGHFTHIDKSQEVLQEIEGLLK